ncbi:hypothetical protein [Massilia glaciei]|uniref:3-oxoacyl-ACP synthase n=1 Tax=Massilia glaciei TaxID=1524097 RepID=A0A2U2H9U5_9BURK|nr:hypothetical protein [Massilia glaciei]PWF39412.1 hypothetical protein C7C56_027100 [Massilia glaciei]
MRGWLGRTLPAAAVVGLCWGGAIWYWRATNRAPSTSDLVSFLLVLPPLVLLALWLGRKLISLQAAPAMAVPAAQPAPPPARPVPLTVVATALRTPHGSAVEELAKALAANGAGPDLDPDLTDDNGFPVITARSDDAADPAMQEAIAAWLELKAVPDPDFSDEQLRALVLGGAVVAELSARAAGHTAIGEPSAQPPMLQIVPLWQGGWRLEQRLAAGMWFGQVVGMNGWPPARIVLGAEQAAETAGAPSAALARLVRQHALDNSPLLALVLACGSHIGEGSVRAWSDSAALFCASRPQGLVPGEGAAGLLLADAGQARLITDEPLLLLHSADGRRDDSADGARRVDAKLLRALAGKVMADAGAEFSTVAMVVADTGHRNSRVTELMDTARHALPQLDQSEDVIRVAAGCGSCGAVPFMSALVLAHHHAGALAAPVLCFSNEDPHHRSAALIGPAAPALS